MSEFEKISFLVNQYIPEFIRDDYSAFADFIKTYYEWSESDTFTPWNVVNNIQNWNDIDTTIPELVYLFKEEFGLNLPIDDIALYIKHFKEILSIKGSARSLRLYTQILEGIPIEIFYPNRYLIKSSDGEWKTYHNIYINTLLTTDYISQKILGITSQAEGIIEDINYVDDNLCLLKLSNVKGNFTLNEITVFSLSNINTTISNIVESITASDSGNNYNGSGNDYQENDSIISTQDSNFEAKITKVWSGSLDSITITSGGTNFAVGDILNFTVEEKADYYALPFAKVSKVSLTGAIEEIDILYKGYGFRSIPVISSITTTSGINSILVVNSALSGAIREIQIIYNSNLVTESSSLQIITENGINAILNLNLGTLFEFNTYKKDGSFLSDEFKLQDSNYWQEYSYKITSSVDLLSKYNDIYSKTLHPVGFKLFADISRESTVNTTRPYYVDSILEIGIGAIVLQNTISTEQFVDRIKNKIIINDVPYNIIIDSVKDNIISSYERQNGSFVSSEIEIS